MESVLLIFLYWHHVRLSNQYDERSELNRTTIFRIKMRRYHCAGLFRLDRSVMYYFERKDKFTARHRPFMADFEVASVHNKATEN